ncbi:MAG: bifunctional sugar-1-phosphate nucleotidylyltransferase/acetyltransferase [Candidatus Methanofastidiosia archaeon]
MRKMNALILCAGRGERLEPLTNTREKMMLEIAGKPLIGHIIDALKPHVSEMSFVLGFKSKVLREYIEKNTEKSRFFYQRRRDGTAKAVALSPYSEFLCLNGDILFEDNLIPEILKFYEKNHNAILVSKKIENPKDFGVIFEKEGRFLKVREKEKNPKSNLASVGIYLFNESIFYAIEKTPKSERGEYELTTSLNILSKREDILVFKYSGFWADVGKPQDILEVNEHLLRNLKHQVLGRVERKATLIPPVEIGEDSIVKDGSYILGPVKIGKNCTLGPNCYVRPYTSIGDGCHIGSAVEIKNSVVFSRTRLPHHNYLGDSVIGENVNFGAGSKVANLRHDNRNIKIELRGKLTDSGRRKFGCIIGDDVKLGINVSILEGRKIGNNCFIGPGVLVAKNIPPFTKITLKQELHRKKKAGILKSQPTPFGRRRFEGNHY